MFHETRGVVMVVDDDEDWRELVVHFLEGVGFEVLEARDGHEALARLRSGARTPDLVLTDLEMPVMTGWELRRELLRDPVLARVPVIVASSADPGAIVADFFLPKPYCATDLLRTVSSALALLPVESIAA
ncbi:response regulator [Anaeromyxobacter terrae]|uniref:response regulator n=1 Tax=Anaeromyxobacter terrae TaxID=2925406 RepID=UPI001F5869AE|nr:response regulator [Anaeromyxobacter sp. SG22]